MGVELFSLIGSNRTRENGLHLHQGKCKWDIIRHFHIEKVTKHLIRLPREMAESLSPEVFKRCIDVH